MELMICTTDECTYIISMQICAHKFPIGSLVLITCTTYISIQLENINFIYEHTHKNFTTLAACLFYFLFDADCQELQSNLNNNL